MVNFRYLLDKDKYLELRLMLDRDIGPYPFTIETYSKFFIAIDEHGSRLVIEI